MDSFEQLLTSGSHGSVSPETLEYIGQKASTEFLEKKSSLNQAIVKLAAQHPGLNNEHIQRIVEFANNATFQHLFEKDKDKNVHFDIARPGDIIRDLRDGGSPAHSGKVLNNADYSRPPIREKDGELDGSGVSDPESGMAELFRQQDVTGQFGQGESLQKVASAGLDPTWEGSANPVNDVYAMHKKLERSKDEISAAYETADLMHKQAQAEFYQAVKHEVLSVDGAGIGIVAAAVEKVAGQKAAGEMLQPVLDRLVSEGVSSGALLSQLNKTAGKLLNPAHPLVKVASGMVKIAQERKVAHAALVDIEAGMKKTAAFLKGAAK